MYSDKDFFGDPLWPTDLDPSKHSVSKSPESQLISYVRSSIILDRNQNTVNQSELHHFHMENEDLQRTFFHSQQKMQFSNLKNSEITYLDDFQKSHIFYQEEEQNPLKPDQKEGKQEFESRIQEILVKFEQEEPFSDHHSENVSSDENYLPEKLLSTINEYFEEKQKKKPLKFSNHRSLIKAKKLLRDDSQLRKQNSIIQQLLDEKCLMDDNQKKRKMLKVENQIIKKLKYEEKNNKQKQQISDQMIRKVKKHNKLPKYKILTQSEKQYLVFLSTLSTTCEVSRRFNISVNNICRWKKGCARKVGAGRKITNQQLQQKVIQYVKDLVKKGESLTRKKVQIKAKEFSEDENFKASKGWFERFYTRNINIFPLQQSDKKY